MSLNGENIKLGTWNKFSPDSDLSFGICWWGSTRNYHPTAENDEDYPKPLKGFGKAIPKQVAEEQEPTKFSIYHCRDWSGRGVSSLVGTDEALPWEKQQYWSTEEHGCHSVPQFREIYDRSHRYQHQYRFPENHGWGWDFLSSQLDGDPTQRREKQGTEHESIVMRAAPPLPLHLHHKQSTCYSKSNRWPDPRCWFLTQNKYCENCHYHRWK